MAKTVVALYDEFITGQRAVQDLHDAGFEGDDISLVVNNSTGRIDLYAATEQERTVADAGADSTAVEHDDLTRGEEAGISAGAGALVGGIGGFLLGLGLVAVPGVGPVLAAGPLATALAGAGIGAVTGGLSGWLFKEGVPEDAADQYVEGVRRGGTLVAVTTSDALAGRAAGILKQHRPVDLQRRATEWHATGGTINDVGVKPRPHEQINDVGVEPYQGETIAREHAYYQTHPENPGGERGLASSSGYNAYVPDFENHYTTNFGDCNYPFDSFQLGYRYGYNLANDERYRDRSWAEVEPEARREWEERNPATWSYFKDAIRFAWERARGQR